MPIDLDFFLGLAQNRSNGLMLLHYSFITVYCHYSEGRSLSCEIVNFVCTFNTLKISYRIDYLRRVESTRR